jgi:hypothetical protein
VSFLERVVNIARRKTQESKGFFSSGTTVLDEVKFVLNKVPNYSPKSIRGLGSDIWKLLGEDYPNFDLKNCLSLSVANCFAAYNTLQSSEFVISIEEQDVLSFIHGCYAVACKQLCRDPQPLLEYEALINNQQLIALCDRSILQNLVDFQTEHLSKVHSNSINTNNMTSTTTPTATATNTAEDENKSSELRAGEVDAYKNPENNNPRSDSANNFGDPESSINNGSTAGSASQRMSDVGNNDLLDNSNPFNNHSSVGEQDDQQPPFDTAMNLGGSSQHSTEVDQVRSYLQETPTIHSSSSPQPATESQQMSDTRSNHESSSAVLSSGHHSSSPHEQQQHSSTNNMIDLHSNANNSQNTNSFEDRNYATDTQTRTSTPSGGENNYTGAGNTTTTTNNNNDFEDFMSRYTESIRRDEEVQNADRNSASDLQDTVGVRTFD